VLQVKQAEERRRRAAGAQNNGETRATEVRFGLGSGPLMWQLQLRNVPPVIAHD